MNVPLPNADHLVGIVFLIMIGLTIFGGLIACNANRLVRAVAGLVVCFVGVAGLYYFLNSPFIAMMQMLIYVGAVAVTISFAIMFAAPEESKKHGPSGTLAGPWVHEKEPITPPNFGHATLFRTFEGQLLMSVHSHASVEGRTVRIPHLFHVDDSGDKIVVGQPY